MRYHPSPRFRRNSPLDRTARFSAAVVAVILLSTGSRVFAVNTGFLPGDACFGSELSEDTLAQFDSKDPVVFLYRAGEGEPALCGYSGYWKLAVRDMPDEMKANLRKLYLELREFDPRLVEISTDENGNEQRREANPFILLIYNKDYDLRQGIGLKLNENWMKLETSLKMPPMQGAYSPYVTDYRAVARDWERGPHVPGLAINETDAQPWWGDLIEEPVSIQADAIQILVLSEQIYTSFAFGTSHSMEVPWDELPLEWEGYDVIEPCFYRVTSEGVSRCFYGGPRNEFVEEPWPLSPGQEQATQIEQLVESLERAGSDIFGIEDEGALTPDVRQQLDELWERLDSVTQKLKDRVTTLRPKPSEVKTDRQE